MSVPPTHDRAEPTAELLARLSWTRRLAAGLVGDDRADDVAQDAWLAAVHRASEAWPPTRAWLAGTVRRMAARAWRGAGRRADRESRAVTAAEPEASTDEVVARGEELRRLADLVLELDEPFRSTLLLRFQEELSPNEIARRLGVPADTVRWRLRSGLERLRERLERRDGAEWRAALLPLVPAITSLVRQAPESAAAATLTGTGGLILGTKWSSAVATVVALLLGVVIWKTAAAGDPSLDAQHDDDSALAAPAQVATRETELRPAASATDAASERRAVANLAQQDESEDAAAVITGRVLGPRDEPVSGARVHLPYPKELPETRTDDEGAFRLVVRDFSAERVQLQVEPEPFLSLHEVWFRSDKVYETDRPPLAAGTVDLGDIRLVTAGVVEGRVTDEAGAAIAKPWMILGRRDGYAYPHAGGRAWGDEDGGYRLAHLRPGPWTIEAQDHGHRIVEIPFEVRAGEVVRVDHVLPDSPTITGVVLDQDGAPIEGVRVSGGYGYMYSQRLTTDARGAFTLQLAVDEAARMEFRHEAYEADLDPNTMFAPNTTDLEVRMTALPRMRFHVVDAGSREPIEEFGMCVRFHEGVAGEWSRARNSSRDPEPSHHEGGSVEFHARPDVDAVRVVAPSYGSFDFDVRADLDAPDRMTIALSSGGEIRGRVVHDGAPVEGARVALGQGSYIAFEQVTSGGVTVEQDVTPAMDVLRSGDGYAIGRVIALDASPPLVGYSRLFALDPVWTTTDAEGRFAFRELPREGRFRLEVAAESVTDASPLVLASVTLEREGADIIEIGDLELPAVTALAGRVELASPGPLAGHRVRLDDFAATTAVTDEQGRFRFERVAPGDHTFELEASDALAAEKATYFVRLGEGVQRELVVPVENAATCSVRAVVTKNGVPLEGAQLRLRPLSEDASGSPRLGRRTDERGVVEGIVPRVGECSVSVFVDGISTATAERCATDAPSAEIYVDLQVGTLALAPPSGRAWPETGRMKVMLTPSGAESSATYHTLQFASGTPYSFGGSAVSDEAGRALVSFVPLGVGSVHVEVEAKDGAWSAEAPYRADANTVVVVEL